MSASSSQSVIDQIFQDRKDAAKDAVNKLPNLSDKEKQDFNKQIDDAKTNDKIDQIVTDAKHKDAQNLQDAKDAGKDVINKLPNLNDQDKDALNKQIDAGQTVDQVQQIVKDAAKDAVNKLPNLSDKEKQDFNKQIDDAESIGVVDQVVNDAKYQDGQNLQDAKDKAKDVISKWPNLDDQAKDALNKQIDAGQTVDQVQQIVKDAAKDAVNKLPNLSDKEKQDFNKQIDDAKTTDAIDQVVKDANALNDSRNLQDAKDAAKDAVNKLPNLSDKEKQDFNKRIDDAKTTDAINQIVNEAKQQDAKDNGKHVIDQLPNLNDREKDDFKRRVDNGQTIDEINRIVADAKAKNAQNLQDAKNNGKQQIEQLPNLTPNQKQDFKNRIDDASSMMEIQNIVDEATQSNAGQVMTGQQAQLPDTAVNAQSDLGVLGGTMLGLLTLFGLGKRRKREEEK